MNRTHRLLDQAGRKHGIVPVLFVMLASLLPACQTHAAPLPPLRVLVISPNPQTEPAKGIGKLLKDHHIQAGAVTWKQSSKALASKYDVLVVTGYLKHGDRIIDPYVRTDYAKPILAVGPYGNHYLGDLHLKNGYPYT